MGTLFLECHCLFRQKPHHQDWLQELELNEEEEQDQSTKYQVGEGGAGCEGLVLIDHDQVESVLNDAQAVKGSNGGEVDQIGQGEANNSGKGGEERANFDENQNKERNQDFINNDAEDPEVDKSCRSKIYFLRFDRGL